jgi:hypothetical protein
VANLQTIPKRYNISIKSIFFELASSTLEGKR